MFDRTRLVWALSADFDPRHSQLPSAPRWRGKHRVPAATKGPKSTTTLRPPAHDYAALSPRRPLGPRSLVRLDGDRLRTRLPGAVTLVTGLRSPMRFDGHLFRSVARLSTTRFRHGMPPFLFSWGSRGMERDRPAHSTLILEGVTGLPHLLLGNTLSYLVGDSAARGKNTRVKGQVLTF